MQSRIETSARRNAMQPRNILIHIVVAFAALHAAVTAAPAAEARACDVCPDGGAVYPGPYVVYPEGYVVLAGSGDVVGR
jgi:hypothetical protein